MEPPIEEKLDRSLEALITDSTRRRQARTQRSQPYNAQQFAQQFPVAQDNRGRLPLEDQVVLDVMITDREDGGITVRYKATDIISLDGSTGEIELRTGGYMTRHTRLAMNACLKPINISVEEAFPDGEPVWQVVDGKTKVMEFEEGITLITVGISRPLLLARGSIVKQHVQQRKRDIENKRRQATRGAPTITLHGTQYMLVPAARPPPPPPPRQVRRR